MNVPTYWAHKAYLRFMVAYGLGSDLSEAFLEQGLQVCCSVLQCVAVVHGVLCARHKRVRCSLGSGIPIMSSSFANPIISGSFAKRALQLATERRRCIGCLTFTGHVLQKSPIISGSFAESDLQIATGLCIGCRIFIGHVPPKSPIISGSFAKRDLQLAADANWDQGLQVRDWFGPEEFVLQRVAVSCSVLQCVAVVRGCL